MFTAGKPLDSPKTLGSVSWDCEPNAIPNRCVKRRLSLPSWQAQLEVLVRLACLSLFLFTVGCEELTSALLVEEAGGPSRGTLTQYCERLSECFVLGEGETVSSCADDLAFELQDLSALESGLCQTDLQACTNRKDCTAFLLCNPALCNLDL